MHYALGDWRRVCEHAAKGVALYRPGHFSHAAIYSGHDSGVCATAKQGVSLWMLGFPDRALAPAEESIARARQLSHPPSLMHALFYALILHHFRRDAAAMRKTAADTLRFARDCMPHWISSYHLQATLISALKNEQQARVRMPEIRMAMASERSADIEGKGFNLCLFGSVCELAGEVEAGLNALQSAISEAEANGARLWESELNRIAGNLLLLAAPDPKKCEAHFLRAIDVARAQQARSLELRAATSLARLWADRGKRRKACDLLEPIYTWFTEGFSTRDLIDAKVLLDKLG
jgi:predicted ATPase